VQSLHPNSCISYIRLSTPRPPATLSCLAGGNIPARADSCDFKPVSRFVRGIFDRGTPRPGGRSPWFGRLQSEQVHVGDLLFSSHFLERGRVFHQCEGVEMSAVRLARLFVFRRHSRMSASCNLLTSVSLNGSVRSRVPGLVFFSLLCRAPRCCRRRSAIARRGDDFCSEYRRARAAMFSLPVSRRYRDAFGRDRRLSLNAGESTSPTATQTRF